MGTTDRSIAQNTILLYIRLIVVIFVAFFTQRLVLKALGVEDYGIYNVVGGLIVVIGIINTGMIQASQRFLLLKLVVENNLNLKTFLEQHLQYMLLFLYLYYYLLKF